MLAMLFSLPIEPSHLLWLALAAFIAGYVDAIAGGGGLITLPALLLAGLDPVHAVATNKLGGTFGSGSATLSFARKGYLDGREILPILVMAGGGAILGALALAYVPRDLVTLVLPFILLGVGLYFLLARSMGDANRAALVPRWFFLGLVIPLIGFYDGVFGPGAGSFYMMAFVALMGFGVLRATAQTKAANFASNATSLVTYIALGHVVWVVGLVMAAAQVCGSILGARTAMRSGARIIRPLLVVVCAALVVRLVSAPDYPLRTFFTGLWPF